MTQDGQMRAKARPGSSIGDGAAVDGGMKARYRRMSDAELAGQLDDEKTEGGIPRTIVAVLEPGTPAYERWSERIRKSDERTQAIREVMEERAAGQEQEA